MLKKVLQTKPSSEEYNSPWVETDALFVSSRFEDTFFFFSLFAMLGAEGVQDASVR